MSRKKLLGKNKQVNLNAQNECKRKEVEIERFPLFLIKKDIYMIKSKYNGKGEEIDNCT